MNLLSHERLNELKAQRNHLKNIYEFHLGNVMVRLGKQGVPNDEIEDEATEEVDELFDAGGLTATVIRIDLEIAYLESELT